MFRFHNKQLFRLDENGYVLVYSVDSGNCIAVVNIKAWRELNVFEGISENDNAQSRIRYVDLTIGTDGLNFVVKDEDDHLILVSLNKVKSLSINCSLLLMIIYICSIL